MTAWKRHELRICRALGGQRSGPLGRHEADCTGTPFAVECKRTTRPCLRGEWLTQARAHAKRDGKPWLLVIAGHNDPRPIVVMDFQAFLTLARDAGRVAAATEETAPECACGHAHAAGDDGEDTGCKVCDCMTWEPAATEETA